MPSDSLRLRRPEIGYARLVIAGNMSNYSTILDLKCVIYLGHMSNVPLMRPPSDLADGLEPHAPLPHAVVQGPLPPVLVLGRRCTRGGLELGGYREGSIPGTNQPMDLRLI